jgi:eukaryotic-like serine/threonine-protein kinase
MIPTPLPPPLEDDPIEALIGREVPSEVVPGVVYRLVWGLGQGGMSVVYYALRVSAEGEVPVVIKMLKPSFVVRAGPTAALIVKKEAIALGRLNERVPPTPFVVRFIDTGLFPIKLGGSNVEVPWVAVEYVHGGAEGTTLSERVDHSLEATGSAFDPARAAHAIECLTSGLAAVHEVGVIHRDLKPDNVLCCGFGDNEIWKLADFGVARPAGIATFTGAVVGTPGFVAPEMATGDPRAIGPWSDIWSLGAVIFFMLTGEEYFSAKNPADALMAALSSERRSILDARGLSPELRARPQACRSIDFALSSATAGKIESRPHRADALAAMLVPWLRVDSMRSSLASRRLAALYDDDDSTEIARWRWNTVKSPAAGLVIRGVAWDGDGRAMVATSHGLAFWNGATWSEASTKNLPDSAGIRFVQRVGAGQWLVGFGDATFATYTSDGVTGVRRLNHVPLPSFDKMSGDLDDLAVLVGPGPSGAPTLCALSGGRWLKPLPLPDLAALSSRAAAPTAAVSPRSTRRSSGTCSASTAPPCAPTSRARVRWIARSASPRAPRARSSSVAATRSRSSGSRAAGISPPRASTRSGARGSRARAASGCAASAPRLRARGSSRAGTPSGRTPRGRCRSSRSGPTSAASSR